MSARAEPGVTNAMTYLMRGGIAIASLWLIMSFTYPFGWDQGLFAWVGGVIVNGGLPYRDAWDIKGPLLYYVYALAEWLFGVHLWSIRIVDACFLAVATLAVFRAARGLTDETAARLAALFFVLWYGSHSFWHTAQPDGWAGMLVIVAVGPLLVRLTPPSVVMMGRAGVCLGLAALLKPLWITFVALPMLYLGMTWPRNSLWLTLALVGGWLLPVGLVIAWFASQGGLGDLIEIHLKYASLYAGLASDGRMRGLVDYLLSNRVMAVSLPVSIYGSVILWKDQRPAMAVLVAWFGITALLVALQGRFYAYHWLPLLPAVALLVAVGASDLSRRAPTFGAIVYAIILLGCVAPIGLELARFGAWRAGMIDCQAYYNSYGEPGIDMQALDWLQTTGAPGKVFTFGWHSSVGWLSRRGTVSRFGYSLPLMMGEGSEFQARYRAELMAALTADPPRYLVVGSVSDQILGVHLSIDDFPELADLAQRAYRPVARFGSITIHEIHP